MPRNTYHRLRDNLPVDLGNFTSIAGGVDIHFPDNHPCVANRKLVTTFPFAEKWNPINFPPSGVGDKNGRTRVSIGSDVWIGEDVKILNGVVIGDGVIVGAHAIVAKDIPPYAVVVGNPAQIVRYRYDKKTIKKLLEIKWWDWEDDQIRNRIDDFWDIDTFIEKYG